MTLRNGGDQEPNVSPLTVAKPDVPVVWLRHARFDHAAHAKRDINCRQCHADAYYNNDSDLQADYYRPRKGAEAVLVPGIDNCKQCHSPTPDKQQADRGVAARSDCAECHNYHHGKREPGGTALLRGRDELEQWLLRPHKPH
jgi:hypothetical protein